MQVLFAGMTIDNTKTFRTHSHPHWEILYYFSGNGVLTIGNENIPFEPGDIICQPPDVPHSESSQNGFYNIHMIVKDFIKPNHDYVPRFRDNSNQDIRNISMFLYREFHLKNKSWNFMVDELFQVIYRYMLSLIQTGHKTNYVKELEDILVSNISNPGMQIKEAQQKIPLSDFYLKRLFKKETGKTPLEYLTQKRIEFAKQLLNTRNVNNFSIKEIAIMSGYEDPYYFSRIFKKVTGVCPTQWVNTDHKHSPENQDIFKSIP